MLILYALLTAVINVFTKIHSQSSKWTPCPISCEIWQRIHADYCGPFLNKFYALVVVDSYSRWPEVYFTTHPTAKFTQQALRKLFNREGVPMVLVTDNGTHFNSKEFEEWLKGTGCRHLFTAPRHPQSNGLAENFVRTLKSSINSLTPTSLTELEIGVDNFLMQYHNSSHSTTHKSPAQLFKSRMLRTNLKFIDSAEVTYFKGNDLGPSTGIVLSKINPIPLNNDNVVSENNSPRRSERIRNMPAKNYKHLEFNSTCGGCDIHN